MKKSCVVLLISILSFCFSSVIAQNSDMFKQKKERKRLWRKHRTTKDAYNPYLNKKAKNKPSAIENKTNKREERRQKRDYKRQLKRSKKK